MPTSIVVMKDGRIAQTGSPLEVFENPRSRFVAGFIGSPPMNFVEGEVTNGPGGLAFSNGALRLPIPSGRFDVKAGQSVTLGLRPEDLVPDGHGLPPRNSIDIVGAGFAHRDARQREPLLFITFGGTELVARMQQPREVAPDELMLFRINVDRIHLFDAATGVSTRVPVAARGPSSQEADVRPH